MPSLLPDYEYDIFISYRHNDNLDGWVTNFVESLQKELRGTLKETLTIYFDKNPHDGLLETHHVDKSLEGKLKCLIFIPIISQTYCDPKFFAWQHEFCAFNKLAQEDQLGRDIKLSNGNVTSRILPIKIHDLDAEDTTTIENEIGGVLRAIEFIYKEAGVNRPLSPDDSDEKNINNTKYKNQVNKVANALKEILYAIKPSNKSFTANLEDTIVHPTKSTRKLGAIIASIVFVLALNVYFLYPKLISIPKPDEIDKSIAVLPFVNMSNDPEQDYFSDGISEEIINRLSQIKGLKVIGRSSSFQFKGKNPDLREVGQILDVSTVLEGSIRKSGNQLRITAQLIRVADGSHVWSQNFNRELEDIFLIQDEISKAIADQMKVSLGFTSRDQVDPELYDLYLRGRTLLINRGQGVELSAQIFKEIIERDSSYQPAWTGLAQAWEVMPTYALNDSLKFNYKLAWPKALHAAEKALKLQPNDAEALSAMASVYRAQRNFSEAFEYFKKALAINAQSAVILEDYTQFLILVGYSKDALTYAQKVIELDPLSANYYLVLADALLHNGKMVECVKVLKAGLNIDPTWQALEHNLIFAYSNLNEIDSMLYILESLKNNQHNEYWNQRYGSWKMQIEAVEKDDQTFDFSSIAKPVKLIDQSDRLFFAMNELNQLDEFFELLFFASKDKYNPINLHSPLTPQGLIYHSERFLSDPRMKEVLNDYGLVEFWQEHGWPDRCKPLGNGDFVCK